MGIRYTVLVAGNSFRFREGFFGFSTIVLIEVEGHAPLLFDTGHHVTRHMLIEALGARGMSTEDIGMIFLSHLHFDHASNVELFPRAKIYVSALEWDYVRTPADDDLFCSQCLNVFLEKRVVNLLHATEGELLPGLYYRHAPGHTPGSYLLHFRDAAGKRVVLAGDACKTYLELSTTLSANEFDPLARSSKTLAWISNNADVVVPGHYPELYRTSAGWVWDDSMHIDLIVR